MKTDVESFCENIRQLRRKLGVSVEEMAQILEITIECLTALENGVLLREVDVGILFLIYDRYGIPYSKMFEENAVRYVQAL